ncbi:hypothetical protein FE257_004105 [Aspergillus nanangensis]|uniref:F-box domain-containing protein n=1 Tax=Aspergillus nanangensis TaxID=2582783 RepID=A0AAD4CC69_ASPNN|nr:hypothetical protein FE257_004105 [Aspergillus nanangensis]
MNPNLFRLPTETICTIVAELDPFDAVRLSQTTGRLRQLVKDYKIYWRQYHFVAADDFIGARRGCLVTLFNHLVTFPGPRTDVTLLESIHRLLKAEYPQKIPEYKDILVQIRDIDYTEAVLRHVRAITEHSLFYFSSTGLFEDMHQGLELLEIITPVAMQCHSFSQWIVPLQDSVTEAAYAGASQEAAQGIQLLENIGQKTGHKIDNTQWIVPLEKSLTQSASLGHWRKFQRTSGAAGGGLRSVGESCYAIYRPVHHTESMGFDGHGLHGFE